MSRRFIARYRTADLGGVVAAIMASDGTYTVVEYDPIIIGTARLAILKLWARRRVETGARAAIVRADELPDLHA